MSKYSDLWLFDTLYNEIKYLVDGIIKIDKKIKKFFLKKKVSKYEHATTMNKWMNEWFSVFRH